MAPDGGATSHLYTLYVSFLTCRLVLPICVSHSLHHQSPLLTKKPTATHSGITHCGLYRLGNLATATHFSLRCSSVLKGGIGSFFGSRLALAVSERPRQRPPELETDCLKMRRRRASTLNHTTELLSPENIYVFNMKTRHKCLCNKPNLSKEKLGAAGTHFMTGLRPTGLQRKLMRASI